MLSRLLIAAVPVAVVGILLLPASGVAPAQPVPVGAGAYGDYYDYDLDNLYDVDPRNYGYLPRSYEYPWLYRPTYAGASVVGSYGYGGPAAYHTPTGAGFYGDGYEDDDWYYDYYDRDAGYFTGLDYEDRRNFRGADYDLLDAVYPEDDYLPRTFVPRRMPARIDYDDWYRETYGDDGFDGVEKPEIEWYDW